jgi:hypothetical protein
MVGGRAVAEDWGQVGGFYRAVQPGRSLYVDHDLDVVGDPLLFAQELEELADLVGPVRGRVSTG